MGIFEERKDWAKMTLQERIDEAYRHYNDYAYNMGDGTPDIDFWVELTTRNLKTIAHTLDQLASIVTTLTEKTSEKGEPE